MTYARRVDTNHKAIVEALRAAGWRVLDLSRVGQGCPDLLVARAGRSILVEVKTAKGKLTADQVDFLAAWPGQFEVIRTVDDAIKL